MDKTERRPFDTSLQGLAALYSQNFLVWLRGSEAVWQQELNSVIVAQQRRADFLIRYTDAKGKQRLLHIEFQTLVQRRELHEELPVRMTTYAVFVLNKYGQVPEQVLVLLQDTAATRRVPDHFAQGGLRVEYEVIRLWEQDPAAILASGLVGLMPLVPLMRGQDVEGLLRASVEVIETELESLQERNEVLAVTGLLSSLRDQRTVVEFFRRRSIMNLLQQTPLFQELTRDIVLEAEQRGRIQALLVQLEYRFGPVPAEVETALQGISDPKILDRLGLAVLQAPDLNTFQQQVPSD
ncbi:hypothetical protein [Gloeobacter kilaueensis]|uniref:DUF4351 domain-containing protein n=1 Tax=Gloeobacter kilaueensis (strain ATCC BAA-2537 / CCAP 1431/1 / ULC 316 / JS1) TaxID=1183438 RepID=U5QJJ4_GLOK1|nr:hypothetical protein [Gloeobacter kilaueensis]AGY59162.1 hypothetical protein GKIL_2916 [Gloeobacter kilaueensis JS1]